MLVSYNQHPHHIYALLLPTSLAMGQSSDTWRRGIGVGGDVTCGQLKRMAKAGS